MGPFGISTSAISATGGPPVIGNVESWNGTSWTEVADLNTGRTDLSGNGITRPQQTCVFVLLP